MSLKCQMWRKKWGLVLLTINGCWPSLSFLAPRSELGILKWRMQSKDEALVPLTINCWPSLSGGQSYVNIEYDSTADYDLQNVVITIPLPHSGPPIINQVRGAVCTCVRACGGTSMHAGLRAHACACAGGCRCGVLVGGCKHVDVVDHT